MRFRTEIEPLRGRFTITHEDKVLLLGSCFTDNIGSRLKRDGFCVLANPMGPLYNPVSIGRFVRGLLDGRTYSPNDFIIDSNGMSHCLDFAMKYMSTDAFLLATSLNEEMSALKHFFENATVLCFTFGSSFIYSIDGKMSGAVGNCHKFPSSMFSVLQADDNYIAELWRPLLDELSKLGKKIILTVSPIRHLAYGLHGNQLGKARLLLACDELTDIADYFPAYEIMVDDLRDYRFYAADMKHPSEVACDYIYDKFSSAYFSRDTIAHAVKCRGEALREAHRPIII